jgi:hypothetical protein
MFVCGDSYTREYRQNDVVESGDNIVYQLPSQYDDAIILLSTKTTSITTTITSTTMSTTSTISTTAITATTETNYVDSRMSSTTTIRGCNNTIFHQNDIENYDDSNYEDSNFTDNVENYVDKNDVNANVDNEKRQSAIPKKSFI